MTTVIIMPQLGESVAEGIIGKWLKNEGDRIDKDEPIVEVITDKVNAEIPSPVAGVLERITQPEGATVAVGQEIAVITDPDASGGEGVAAGQIAGARSGSAPSPSAVGTASGVSNQNPSYGGNGQPARGSVATLSPEAAGRGERVRSSPLVRRLAEEHSINLSEVAGTGIGGRVSKQDVLSFVEQRQHVPAGQPHFATETIERPAPRIAPAQSPAPSPAPPVQTQTPTSAEPPGPVQPAGARELGPNEELVPVPPLRKMIAERMVLSAHTIPHATTFADVDMTAVMRFRDAQKDQFRERTGVPLSLVAFVVKATVEALHQFPMVNAEWAGDNIIMKKNININVAVDAPEGLTTPVVHNADEKNLVGLSKSIYDLAIRGRNRKLTIQDMQGGTFTVNNTGALGSVSGVSIINYPQAGILSCGSVVKQPVVVESEGEDTIAIRQMMNLAFTFDHRLLDGGYAVAFVNAVKSGLEGWRQDYSIF